MTVETAMRGLATALLVTGAFGLAVAAAGAHEAKTEGATTQAPAARGTGDPGRMTAMPGMPNMRMPSMDRARGRALFVNKGCVACHAINGVGGHDATALDAHTMEPMMNPFEFAAKMWRMAPFMIAAQEGALGEQILFTGDELADIVAFVHDDAEQHQFTEADLTPEARRMMHHDHGEPGGGPEAHGEELGHHHGDDQPAHGHGSGEAPTHSD